MSPTQSWASSGQGPSVGRAGRTCSAEFTLPTSRDLAIQGHLGVRLTRRRHSARRALQDGGDGTDIALGGYRRATRPPGSTRPMRSSVSVASGSVCEGRSR